MTQEDIKALSTAASAEAASAAGADGTAGSAQESQKDEKYFEAFNLNIKTKDEVQEEFTSELGFDPYDIDQMAAHTDGGASESPFVSEQVANLMELQQAMSVMLIERFNKNMEAFKKYIPDIYEKFHDYKPKETLEFMCTSNGVPNLYLPERNEFFYKTYDPEALCKKQVDTVLESCPFRQLKYSIDHEVLGQIHHRYLNAIVKYQNENVPPNANPLLSNSCPIAILMGVGLGYHIGYLYERIEIGNVVVIEPNTDIFFASLHAFDWANLLEFINENQRGIFLMVGQTRDEVFEDLNNFYGRHGRMLACFMWSMVHYRSKEINEIADRLIEDYERSYATLGFFDDHMFAVSHGIQLIKNKVHFMRRGYLKDEYIQIPICVVANGPSLSHDLPFLRKVQDKVFIFACGTALETLYNAGIRPDFYGCTERLKVVSEHLSIIPDRDFVRGRILVSGDVVHPDVTKMFDHAAVFGKADENFYWLAAAKLYDQFRHVSPISLMNPLVGNLGVSAVSQMGFRNIYFFGVDNGTKREDRMTHPDENLFYNDISIKKQQQKEESEDAETSTEDADKAAMEAAERSAAIDESVLPVSEDDDEKGLTEKDKKTLKRRKNRSKSPFPLNMEMDGNFGGKVATSYLYRLSARYMDVIMRNGKKNGNINYFNCSDGAKLKEAEPIHSEDLSWWLDLPDIDRKKFLDYMDNEKTLVLEADEAKIKEMVDPTVLDMVIDLILKVLEKEERPKTRLEYVFMMQTICEILNKLRETRDYYVADFVDGSLYSMFAMCLRSLYLIKDEEEAIKITEGQIKYIVYFLDDVKKLYRFLPDYCAEDHQVHLNGKVGYDHPDCPATPVPHREPLVTQEDQDNYPVRKFVKRYE